MSNANSDQATASFDRLWRDQDWLQIANCPGRYRLRERDCELSPRELTGMDVNAREYDLPACRDQVLVIEMRGGGLISYRRSNGTYVHTLNTAEGFARKLEQLGIG